MTTGLAKIHQISMRAHDVDRATRFYRDTLGVPFLFAFPPESCLLRLRGRAADADQA
jgi:catechol 2,3-dioxygenase-like lactoylglutathione lyase family enzyme